MALKEHLNKEFEQKKLNGQEFGEVEMFESMLGYFANKQGCAIMKTHQLPVSFNQNNTKCESSDLMIVSYSKRSRKCIKITFLQAKLALHQPKLPDVFRFKMDTNQYLLLKECPTINPMQTGLPSNILSDSCSPSITSYGVFYENNLNKLDFAYEITQLLKPCSPITWNTPHNRNKVCYFDATKDIYGCLRWKRAICSSPHHCHCLPCIDCFCCHLCGGELLSSIDANKFEKALKRFQIGSPLCIYECVEQISNIVSVLQHAKAIGRASEEVVDDFMSYISEYIGNNDNNNNLEGVDGKASLNPSYILLVNADNDD